MSKTFETEESFKAIFCNLPTIRDRLRALLAHREETSTWLSRETGIHKSQVSRLLNGTRQPSAKQLALLAVAFDIGLPRLLEGTPSAPLLDEALVALEVVPAEPWMKRVSELETELRQTLERNEELEKTITQYVNRNAKLCAALERLTVAVNAMVE